MQVGTKSLLFGCHQFILHPLFVGAAWIKIYHKLPNRYETLCIITHDWGYCGKPNMDGPEGEAHTEWTANRAWRHFVPKTGMVTVADYEKGRIYYEMCMYHSRFQAKKFGHQVSPLCLPDKVGVAMMPTWLWVMLGKLSGEVREYMSQSKYEINKNTGPSGKDYRSAFDFFRAYKKKCKEWETTGNLTINDQNIV
jgi:hypothetical protein